ncbi:MAG: hypothetical protein ACE5JJ_03790 [Nitrospinota bacterium]
MFQVVSIPEGHPLRRYLGRLTCSSFDAVGFRDREVVDYVSRMLVDFVHVDNLFRRSGRGRRLETVADFLEEFLDPEGMPERELRRQMGDFCLFFTGLYPDTLEARSVSPGFYVSQGKAAYRFVSEYDAWRPTAATFRKLAEQFEWCVQALNLEREFLHDPFYQYLIRQMGI